jgi:WD40 repeat protein
VKKITAPFPIQTVNFSSDGHTLAVGSQMNGQLQQCLVYDLRKSSSVSLALQGHQQAVNCIRFASKIDSKDPSQRFSGVGLQQQSKKSEMKTIEQIREEAK